ncbi:hypothetical protein CFP56_033284 [Quercus suber]
MGTAR